MLRKITPFVIAGWLAFLPGSGDGGYAVADETTCDTLTEDALQAALVGDEDKLVARLEGEKITSFAAYLAGHGYLTGTLSGVDSIYIIKAGQRPGFENFRNYWLFFIINHCLVTKIGADANIIDEAIK